MNRWREDEVIEKCFFQENGCTKHEGGFHQTHRCTYAGALADAFVQKTFFGQLLYTSAVAMVTQVRDPAEAGDWLEESEGEEGRGTLSEGYGEGARHKDN